MFTIPSSTVYSYSMLSRFAPSLALPVYSYGVSDRSSFYHFIRRRLFTLLIIVSVYRWVEIGDITTVDSHYKGSGVRSERSERYWYHPPSIFTYGPPTEVGAHACACFYSYGCYLSRIEFLMFERFHFIVRITRSKRCYRLLLS
jgi:hypothetical protein